MRSLSMILVEGDTLGLYDFADLRDKVSVPLPKIQSWIAGGLCAEGWRRGWLFVERLLRFQA